VGLEESGVVKAGKGEWKVNVEMCFSRFIVSMKAIFTRTDSSYMKITQPVMTSQRELRSSVVFS